MKHLLKTICCGALLLPAAVQAEEQIGGQVVLGYGAIDGVGQSYGILDLTASNEYDLGGAKLDWNLRGRLRSDQADIGKVEANNIDASFGFDFGAGGRLGFTTFIETYDQKPWADGDLYNRGSVGVFPVLQKRYDGVRDSQFTAGGPTGQKVDPDLLLTYSNRFGSVGFDFAWNVLGTWDGFQRSEMDNGAAEFALAEAKFTLPTEGYGIYSLEFNNIGDAQAQVVVPMRDKGLTLIARHGINEGQFDQYLTNLVAVYRPQGMGLFKGAFLAHAFNDTAKRSVLSLGFGDDKWEVKIAGDTDGDYALEGAYNFTDQTALQFGWDNGFANAGGPGNGFDDTAFPAPVFAAARGSAFEVALAHKF